MSHPLTNISELKLTSDVRKRVESLMSHIREGSTEELRSPLFDGQSANEILDGWEKVTETLPELVPPLREMELANRSKFGPRSIAVPWSERRADILAYFRDEGGRSLEPSQVGFHPLRHVVNRLQPTSFVNTIKSMVLNTSSGLPEKTRTVWGALPICRYAAGTAFLPVRAPVPEDVELAVRTSRS